MSRRRLRIISSSDEEDESRHQQQQVPRHLDEDDDIEPDFQDPTLNLEHVSLNSSNPNPNSTEPIQVEISDDDFFEVSEDLSPSPPPAFTAPPQSIWSSAASRTSSVVLEEASDCPVSRFLEGLGLRLRREWLDSCIHGLGRLVPGFSGLNVAAKAKLCFEQFLCSDMNISGAGVLPDNVHNLHLVDLEGPFVLQVDEIVNISRPLRGRYQNAPSGLKRCLKLSMTDGVQRVFGMEYRPIKNLEVLAPAGIKVAICNVNVRHGLFMLVPEVFEILGGLVEELDAARQRLVTEVNKPPRGKRTRTGVVPPLATRATLAAWPPDDAGVAPQNVNSAPEGASNVQVNQGSAHGFPINEVVSEASAAANKRESGGATSSATVESTVPSHMENSEPPTSDATVLGTDNAFMADAIEHPSILTGDRELPFNYLASLSVKWATMKDRVSYVQGKIKCFLTGVNGFQYKRRSTFELRVYVDDGSLISEILIDHHVVQRGIGYSPEEVTAALASSDLNEVCGMKEKLKQFQLFLVNFEGTMLVQINETSSLPVAIEMNQGCPVSDAWLLLRRLKPSYSPLSRNTQWLNPISISP